MGAAASAAAPRAPRAPPLALLGLSLAPVVAGAGSSTASRPPLRRLGYLDVGEAPDRTSEVACLGEDVSGARFEAELEFEAAGGPVCFLALRRRGRLLQGPRSAARPPLGDAPRWLAIGVGGGPYSRLDAKWRRASLADARQGVFYALRLGGLAPPAASPAAVPRRAPAPAPGGDGGDLGLELSLGRLRFAAQGSEAPRHCATEALWLAARRCPGPRRSPRSDPGPGLGPGPHRGGGGGVALWAALTAAVLGPSGALPGALVANRVWVDVFLAGADSSSAAQLDARLDAPGAADVFHLALLPTLLQWAAAHAAHPAMREMGSFIGPSESHPRAVALPLLVVAASAAADGAGSEVPAVPLGWVFGRLLARRPVERLVLHAPAGGRPAPRSAGGGAVAAEAVAQVLGSAGAALSRVAAICLAGDGAPGPTDFLEGAAQGGLDLELVSDASAPAGSRSSCFRYTAGGQPEHAAPLATGSPLLLMDKANAAGVQLQAAVAVAPLDAHGRLRLLGGAAASEVGLAGRLWVEVGCNNWEMLHDEAGRQDGVWLLTFEPLVDKYAYLVALAAGRPWHTVLPFAIAPAWMGSFLAIRSQNYTDFGGQPGRRFQESGASSLLPYAAGFRDHRWRGAAAQYQHFREYSVPTVSLRWVVEALLGGRDIDFLKIDAQGLDYGVFASLGPSTRAVRRVQMELHSHVRHNGELPCSEVVERMTIRHHFAVERGACAVFDPEVHDEVDLVFRRF